MGSGPYRSFIQRNGCKYKVEIIEQSCKGKMEDCADSSHRMPWTNKESKEEGENSMELYSHQKEKPFLAQITPHIIVHAATLSLRLWALCFILPLVHGINHLYDPLQIHGHYNTPCTPSLRESLWM
jgi:hypothetical protein